VNRGVTQTAVGLSMSPGTVYSASIQLGSASFLVVTLLYTLRLISLKPLRSYWAPCTRAIICLCLFPARYLIGAFREDREALHFLPDGHWTATGHRTGVKVMGDGLPELGIVP